VRAFLRRWASYAKLQFSLVRFIRTAGQCTGYGVASSRPRP